MRILARQCFLVGGRFEAPVSNSQTTWHHRQGLLFCLTDELSNAGWGEASPLPGYSPDNLEDCERGLRCLDIGPIDLDSSDFHASDLGKASRPLAALPAARFALETALVDLVSRRLAEPAWKSLSRALGSLRGAIEPQAVPLSALLTVSNPTDLIAQGEAALSRGIRTVKVKVGSPGAWSQELGLLDNLRGHFGDSIALRLDANRAWPAGDALGFLASLAQFDPEFVEEPVRGLTASGWMRRDRATLEARAVLQESPVPLALDESLQDFEAEAALEELLQGSRIRAIVVKPTAVGGLARSANLARLAQQLGAKPLLSHTFDGPLALTAARGLALALGEEWAAGLDQHAALRAYPSGCLPGQGLGALHPWSEPGWGGAQGDLAAVPPSEGPAREPQ